MNPVSVEASIVLNGKQLERINSSIKKVKKRLHDAEMILSFPPQREEAIESLRWNKSVDKIMTMEIDLGMPTMSAVIKDLEEKSRSEEEVRSRQKKYMGIPPRSIERLNQSRQAKSFGESTYFGPKDEGQLIGEVKDYGGMNSIYTKTRPLVRQDPKCYIGKKVTSLPPWIGPDHYQSDELKPLQNRPDSSYQVSFRAESRQKVSVDELRAKKMAQTEISTAWLRKARKPVVPEYAQAVDCERPHSAEMNPDCVSPFSRQSALSSLGHAAPASHLLSPTRVLLGDKSVTRSLSTSALHTPAPMDGNIGNTNIRLRPLKDKFAKASQPKWSVHDYTMGALQYQRVVDEAAHIQQFEVETQEFESESELDSTHHKQHGHQSQPSQYNHSNKEKRGPPGVPTSPHRPGGKGQGQGQASSPGAPHERGRDDASEMSPSASHSSHGSHRSPHSVHSLTPSSYSSVPVLRVTNINSALSNAEDIQRSLMQKKEDEAMPNNAAGRKSPGGSWPKSPLFITTNEPPDGDSISTMTIGSVLAGGGEGLMERTHARYLHLVGGSRLESDVKPLLRRWARDSSLYTPSRPQHVKFLRAHKSDPPVGVGGLLLGDEAACGPDRAHALMEDLGIDEGYFEALAHSPINPKTAPSLHGDDTGDLGSRESAQENASAGDWELEVGGWLGPGGGSED